MQTNLSIIIPAYNEEKRIGKTITELLWYLDLKKIKAEVVIVDDGSKDRTLEILKFFKKRIKIVPIWPNRGKGFAVSCGIIATSGERVLFMDADLATPVSEIEKIINWNSEADIVIGTRIKSPTVRRNFLRSLAGNIFHLVSKLILATDVSDSQCGFKLFKRHVAEEIFDRLKIDRWAFDLEVLFIAKKLGCKTVEMPVSWREKADSKVHLLRDSFLMLKDLFGIRLKNLFGLYNLDSLNLEKGGMDELFKRTAEKSQKL